MYLAAVQHQPPAVRLKGDLAMILRQRAERTMAQGGNFSGMDLTGVDFSGMDFRGANFEKALLECADLSHCQLDNASFQGQCWPERSYSIRRCVTVILAAPARYWRSAIKATSPALASKIVSYRTRCLRNAFSIMRR